MGKVVKSRYLVFICVVLVLSYVFYKKKDTLHAPGNSILQNIPFESVLQDIKIRGLTKNGYRWTIIAKKIMVKKEFSEIYFTNPSLDLIKNECPIFINSSYGVYNRNTEKIELWDKVIVKYKDITLKSPHLIFYIKDNLIKLSKGIDVKNKQMHLFGTRGVLDIDNNIFQIMKNVKVKII